MAAASSAAAAVVVEEDEIEEHYWEAQDFHLVEGAVQKNSNCWVVVDSSSFDLVVLVVAAVVVVQIDYWAVEAVVGQMVVVVAFEEGVGIHHHRRRLVVVAFHHVVAVVACWVEVENLFHLLLEVVALDSRSLWIIDLMCCDAVVNRPWRYAMRCSWRFWNSQPTATTRARLSRRGISEF